MELLGIVGGFFVLVAALWGVQVGIAVVFGFRPTTRWIRSICTFVVVACVCWVLAALWTSAPLGIVVRRSLMLLNAGLLIAFGDAIARITDWIDCQTDRPGKTKNLREPNNLQAVSSSDRLRNV
ncbi:MAG TPA: hypothetical protein VGI78_04980 [Acetobacteraceae bacterium]|jgi:cation transport ATPase